MAQVFRADDLFVSLTILIAPVGTSTVPVAVLPPSSAAPRILKLPSIFGNPLSKVLLNFSSLTRGHDRERIGRFRFGFPLNRRGENQSKTARDSHS